MSNSFATPWTLAHQTPLSMAFSRQEYWSGVPSPSLRSNANSFKILQKNWRVSNNSKVILWDTTQSLSHTQFFVTPWTVACQVPLPMGFSKQGYWSGLPFPPPGDLPNPGIKLMSLVSPALAGRFFTTVPCGKSKPYITLILKADKDITRKLLTNTPDENQCKTS